ncbi:MAG: hypothetical protein E7401_05420 [Ruminococcaceae bacterium]|nr:hypothetical protein [Oscillospiraceae bacterium]
MKRTIIRKNLSNHLKKNKWQYLFVFLSIFSGILAGSLTASMSAADKFEPIDLYVRNFVSAYNLQTVNGAEIFRFSVYNSVKVILFMWVSGLCVWFMPLSLVQLGAKGYKLGISMAAFVRIFGVRGILFAVISALPQLLLFLPAMAAYAVFNIKFSMTLLRMRGQRVASNIKNEMYLNNFLHLLGIITVSVMCSLADAFVMPIILKPVCAFLIR